MQEMQASAWVIKIIPLLSIWHIYVNLAFQLSLLCLNTFKGMQQTQIVCWNINSERNNLFGVSLILHLYFINGQLYISSHCRVQSQLGFPAGSVLVLQVHGFALWMCLGVSHVEFPCVSHNVVLPCAEGETWTNRFTQYFPAIFGYHVLPGKNPSRGSTMRFR